jgi:hypothetical protein
MAVFEFSSDALWATEHGEFGGSNIVVVDTSKWSEKQWHVYNDMVDRFGEIYPEDLKSIDIGDDPRADDPNYPEYRDA